MRRPKRGFLPSTPDSFSFLVKMVGGMRPGTVVAVEVQRGPEALTLKVKLGSRPADFPATPQRILRPHDDPRP
jgi:hypothetical protein